jgi:hypothetical protein
MGDKPLRQVSFFSPEFINPDCLTPGEVPWVLARFGSALFPTWLFEGWSRKPGRGREAWNPLVLVSMLVLRFLQEGMSRRASVKRAKTDMTWRAALGLAMDEPSPGETTVRRFESFLAKRDPRSGTPRYLLVFEQLVRGCMLDAGLVSEAVWATDSTPMWCHGAVRDTVRLLGDGLRMLVGRYSRITGMKSGELATQWHLPLLESRSVKGHYRIDWSDAQQRSSVVEQLAQDVVRVVGMIRGQVEQLAPKHRRDLLRRCAKLLKVVQQGLESDESGRLVVAQRVARDRLVSLTDPQARHGRKSRSQTYNGFKIHVVGDVVSGLISAVAVTSGNQHDSKPAARLIRRAKELCGEIGYVLGDTAYGGAELRHVVKATTSVELVSPPPPTVAQRNRLTRKDFDIDLDCMQATCPAGQPATTLRFAKSSIHQVSTPVFGWDTATCNGCPQSEACRGGRKRGQFITLHPFERELRDARAQWQDPVVREMYRPRSQCERLVNQLVRHGGRQARSFGLGAAQLQVHVIAVRCNLAVFGKRIMQAEAQVEMAA